MKGENSEQGVHWSRGEGVSLQQFPRSAQLGGGFSQAVNGEPTSTFILK